MFVIPPDAAPDSPWPIFERLLESHEELAELKSLLGQDIRLAFMLRAGEWKSGGRFILGKCYCGPSAQGDLRPLFEQLLEDTLGYYPDFLIVLSLDWWESVLPEKREVLLFHELLHAGQAKDQYGTPRFNRQTGQPVTCIVPHDLEEFNAVVRRYGAWSPDVAEFLAAAGEGESAQSDLTPSPGIGRDSELAPVSAGVSDSEGF